METKTTDRYFLPLALFLGLALIAGAIFWNGQHPASGGTQQGATQPTAKVDIKNVKTNGEPYYGNPDAPVVIAFWSDFQCPFCKAFETGGVSGINVAAALPDILKNYVNSGQAKIVFKDFAFLGNDSITAGEYGRAIWKLYPDQYFAWRTAMYTAQDQEGDQGFGNAASIDKLDATITGIDAAKVAADVKANASAYKALIDADKAEGQALGVNATPSFVIGTQLISGAYPYANFQAAIDTVLKK